MVEFFGFVILFFLCSFNGRLAKQKNRSSLAWYLLTCVGYFILGPILASFYIMIIYKGPYEPVAMQDFIKNAMLDIRVNLTVTALSVGGALIMRFILEKLKALPPKV